MSNTMPPPSDLGEALLAEVADEFRARLGRGEQPDIEEYVQRYPQFAAVFRQLLPALAVLRERNSAVPGPDVPLAYPEPATGCLGDYRLLGEIGRGGMGIVYEAEQISLGRRVAVKVLPFAAAMDAKQLKRFQNEAHAAAHLHHTNIVPVYAVGCERGVHFYAMQYIEGQTMAALIRELRQLAGLEVASAAGSAVPASALASELLSGRWAPSKPGAEERVRADGSEVASVPYQAIRSPPPRVPTTPFAEPTPPMGALSTQRSTTSPAFFRTVAHLGVQAAAALEHAHAKGIIHRDIKPANLLLDAGGNLWITDFGLARMANEAGLTMTGDLVGTLRYMSPEQALAKRVLIDHRTDIYSLGATLYELLSLEPAFSGRDRQELLRQISFEEPRLPRHVNKRIPAELETIVLKAMEKNPTERYATAQELAEDLERFLKDEPIRARRRTLAQRAVKWGQRHRTVVWAGVLLLMVALIGSAVSTLLIARERDQANANYQRAEDNLETAYKILDEIYIDAAERRLPQQKELTAEDRRFLERALTFYKQFAKQQDNTPKARLTTAQAYLRVADIRNMLSQYDAAKETYRHALTLLDGLVAESPDNPEYRHILARGLFDMADVIHENYFDTEQERETALRRTVELRRSLASEYPAMPDYQQELGDSYASLGVQIRQDHQRLHEAETVGRLAVDLHAKLAEEYPTAPKYRQSLGNSLGGLGNTLVVVGKHHEAEEILRRNLDVRKRLVDDLPGLPYPRLLLGWAYRQQGNFLRTTTRRLEEAEENLRQELAVFRKLVDDFPGVAKYRVNLAYGHQELAEVWWRMGRVPEAAQAYRDVLAVWEGLPRDYHENLTDCAFSLSGYTQCTLGHLEWERGQSEAALAWFDQATATLKTLCAKKPTDFNTRKWLSNARGGRAEALINLGRLSEAEQAYRELERVYQEDIERDPSEHWYWFCIAPLRLRKGDVEGYRRVCREMLARFRDIHGPDMPGIAERTAKTCLLVPDALPDLGPILQLADRALAGVEPTCGYCQFPYYCWFPLLKGMAEYRAGHFDNAIYWLTKTLSQERDPWYAHGRSLPGTAYLFLAMAHHRLGHATQARQALDQGTALAKHPYRNADGNWNFDLEYTNWLRFHIIRAEAEQLVTGKAQAPQ